MPRHARSHLERGHFHVLNRGNHRQTLLAAEEDYAAFIDLLGEAQRRFDLALWGYCLMSNHWHVVAEVEKIEDLSRSMHWLCTRHARLFHLERRQLGGGHVYQGRYKSFPIQEEGYLYQVLRYVEANPVRARLVERGRDWPWSSLSRHEIKRELVSVARPKLCPWSRNEAWEVEVDRPMEAAALLAMRQCAMRGTPFGDPTWVRRAVVEQGLESTIRPPGRPRKTIPIS